MKYIASSKGVVVGEVFECLNSGGDRAAVLLGGNSVSNLYVPDIYHGDEFTGVGIGNGSFWKGRVTLFGYSGATATGEVDLGSLAALGSSAVPPEQDRIKALLSSILTSDTLWAKLSGDTGISTPAGTLGLPLQGIGVYGERGLGKLGAVSLNQLKFRDGFVGLPLTASNFEISLLNPGADAANVQVFAYKGDGSLLASGSVSIGGGELWKGPFDSLFDSALDLSSASHIEIVSDVDLYGFEVIYEESRMEMLPMLK